MDKLEEEISSLIMLNNASDYVNCMYDSFNDLEKIDMDNTTADVSITAHTVAIAGNEAKSVRITKNPVLSLTVPDFMVDYKITISGDLANVYDDYDNTFCSCKIDCLDPAKCYLNLFIDFGDDPSVVNKIHYEVSSDSPIQMTALYSPDGANGYCVPALEESMVVFDNVAEISFDEILCKEITFVMMKDQYSDSYSDSDGNMRYIYDFTIKKSNLYSMEMDTEGVLISKELAPVKNAANYSVTSVAIDVDEDKPSGTDIKYYVGLPEENMADVNWIPISPLSEVAPEFPTTADFMNQITQDVKIVSLSSNLQESIMNSISLNGSYLYSLYSTDDIISKCSVTKGYNSLLVETGRHIDCTIPTMNQFVRTSESYSRVSAGESTAYLGIHEQMAIKISLYFDNSSNTGTLLLNPKFNAPTSVYLNGRLILNGATIDMKNYRTPSLRGGVNCITIISNIGNSMTYSANLGSDLVQMFGGVYASSQPMTYVSLFELQNKVLSNDHSKYSLYEAGGKTHIVINHEDTDIKYAISYTYSGQQIDTVLFKAVLSRQEDVNTTPVLRRYMIYCE